MQSQSQHLHFELKSEKESKDPDAGSESGMTGREERLSFRNAPPQAGEKPGLTNLFMSVPFFASPNPVIP